jgi:hypothetical protein
MSQKIVFFISMAEDFKRRCENCYVDSSISEETDATIFRVRDIQFLSFPSTVLNHILCLEYALLNLQVVRSFFRKYLMCRFYTLRRKRLL